tara:strand:- start:1 stop:444 length:444 start_codon:yes stop_codon:yes gene_type:complete
MDSQEQVKGVHPKPILNHIKKIMINNIATMSIGNRDDFMCKYFSLLPHDLQNKIFCEHAKMTFPKPAYSRGSFVKYTKTYHNQCVEKCTLNGDIHIDLMQDGLWTILQINEEPEWCNSHEQYIYNFTFEFGGPCEGMALEEDLELVY